MVTGRTTTRWDPAIYSEPGSFPEQAPLGLTLGGDSLRALATVSRAMESASGAGQGRLRLLVTSSCAVGSRLLRTAPHPGPHVVTVLVVLPQGDDVDSRDMHSVGAGSPGLLDLEPMTVREKDALRLLAQGKTNKQIAAALGITVDTTKKHVQAVIGKLGAVTRTQAVVKALRAGMV